MIVEGAILLKVGAILLKVKTLTGGIIHTIKNKDRDPSRTNDKLYTYSLGTDCGDKLTFLVAIPSVTGGLTKRWI